MILQLWLVVSTPLKNIGQLGLFFPHNMYIYIYGINPNVPKTTNQHKWYPLLSSTTHRPSHVAYLHRVSKDLLSFHRVFAMIVPMDKGLSENWVTPELMIQRLRGPFFPSGKHIKKLWNITLFNG